MAIWRDIRGTTPSYTVLFRDSNRKIIAPTSYALIEIYIYNMATGTEIVKYTTESPTPEGFQSLTPGSERIDFTIPEALSLIAESGDTRIEVWTEDQNGIIEADTEIFNEFIDAQNAL